MYTIQQQNQVPETRKNAIAKRFMFTNYVNEQPKAVVTTNIVEYVSGLSALERKFLDLLFFFAESQVCVFPSHERLSSILGCTNGTINKIIKRFKEDGILYIQKRGYRKTQQYFISSYFVDYQIKSRLRTFFKTFKYLSILLLLTGTIFSRELTQVEFKKTIIRREKGDIYINNHSTTKRRVTISAAVENLTCLPLTPLGKIKLSAFPDDAILYAEKKMVGRTNIRKPFAWFMATCFDYCKIEGLKPDWHTFYFLAEKQGLPIEGEVMEKPKKQYIPIQTVNTHLLFKETKIPTKTVMSDNGGYRYRPVIETKRLYPVYEKKEEKREEKRSVEDQVIFYQKTYTPERCAAAKKVGIIGWMQSSLFLREGILFDGENNTFRSLKEGEKLLFNNTYYHTVWDESLHRYMPVEIKKEPLQKQDGNLGPHLKSILSFTNSKT